VAFPGSSGAIARLSERSGSERSGAGGEERAGAQQVRHEGNGSESWTIGAEFNRADVKRSKGGQTFAPFDVLREFAATGDLALRDVWQAYEAATFGLAQLQYSTGFKNYIEKLAERVQVSSEVVVERVALPDVIEVVDQADADEEDDELIARSEGHVPYV
jgi:hypothetical protein